MYNYSLIEKVEQEYRLLQEQARRQEREELQSFHKYDNPDEKGWVLLDKDVSIGFSWRDKKRVPVSCG